MDDSDDGKGLFTGIIISIAVAVGLCCMFDSGCGGDVVNPGTIAGKAHQDAYTQWVYIGGKHPHMMPIVHPERWEAIVNSPEWVGVVLVTADEWVDLQDGEKCQVSVRHGKWTDHKWSVSMQSIGPLEAAW